MTDREALLAAILANPADDVPRLVFADWLDEHGDHDRAEFIRVQCELARLEDDERGDVEPYRYVGWDTAQPAFVGPPADVWRERDPEAFERVRLSVREWELLSQLLPRLVGELPGVMRGTEYAPPTFRRGFGVEWTFGGAVNFFRHAPAVFRRAPVESVRLYRDRPGDEHARLVELGFLDRVTALHLRRSAAGAELLERLARTPTVQSLTSLKLDPVWEDEGSDDSEPAEPGRLVVAVTAFPNLRRFEADAGPSLPADDLARLFASPTGQGLTHLTLTQGACNNAGVEALARIGSPNLRALNLSQCSVTFRPSAVAFPNLRTLNLTGCETGPADAASLLFAPALSRLEHLALTGNPTAGLGRFLSRGYDRPPTLRTLRLLNWRYMRNDPGLTPADVSALVASPALTGLLKLSLDSHQLGDDGAARLADAPGLRNLVTLTVPSCDIGPAGAAALASSPHLAGLAQLELCNNPIGRDGAEALARSPYLTKMAALLVDADAPGVELLRDRFGGALHALEDQIPF